LLFEPHAAACLIHCHHLQWIAWPACLAGMHELLSPLLLHQSSRTLRHILHQLWNSKRWMLLVMEKGFLPLLDIRGLILGMLVTFSYA
jgi:hypothetical protein